MFRLVSAGHGDLALSGWDTLNRTALDVLLDFAYGMLTEHADAEDRKKIDHALAELDAPREDKMITMVRRDGTEVTISEKRLSEMQSRVANIHNMRTRKG